MRDLKRIEKILFQLGVLWAKPENSDMRLGQFLINYGIIKDDYNVWMTEDEVWLKHLKELNKNEKNK